MNVDFTSKVVLMRLVSRGTNWERQNSAITEEVKAQHGASADVGRWTDKLLPPDDIKPIQRIQRAAREHFRTHTLRWKFEDGAGLVPVEHYQQMRDSLRVFESELRDAIAVLVGDWQNVLGRAQEMRNGLFKWDDYPSDPAELYDRYAFEVNTMPLPNVDDLGRIFGTSTAALRETVAGEVTEQLKAAEQASRVDLYGRLAERIEMVIGRLDKLDTGESKMITAPMMTGLADVARIVEELNVHGDTRLSQLAADIAAVASFPVEMLRGAGSETFRAVVKGKANEAAAALAEAMKEVA